MSFTSSSECSKTQLEVMWKDFKVPVEVVKPASLIEQAAVVIKTYGENTVATAFALEVTKQLSENTNG